MLASMDDLTNPPSSSIDVDCKNVAQAIGLVGRLDGKRHTMLNFDNGTGWCLTVAGGADFYVVVKSDSNQNSVTLVNEAPATTARMDLCCGGQLADFEPEVCCPKSLVVAALSEYFGDCLPVAPKWRPE